MFDIHSLKISISPSRKVIFIFRQCFVAVEQLKEIRFLTQRRINAKYMNELGNIMGS
jgi:hypothetical protein